MQRMSPWPIAGLAPARRLWSFCTACVGIAVLPVDCQSAGTELQSYTRELADHTAAWMFTQRIDFRRHVAQCRKVMKLGVEVLLFDLPVRAQ